MPTRVIVPTIPGGSFRLPPQLEGLRALAYNLYWAWHPRTRVDLEPDRSAGPGRATATRSRSWPARSTGADFSTTRASWPRCASVLRDFDRYIENGSDRWFVRHHAADLPGPVAYFCAEYGLYESLGIYSGGLGVLAGDHMKTTSDMALPFVGVGLMYRRGYFHQTIDADGHQEHAYPDYDLSRLPVGSGPGPRRRAADGQRRPARARPPDARSGRSRSGGRRSSCSTRTFPRTHDADRPITHILYVRGREMRLHQELVLGVGGVRALRALGIDAGGLAPQRGPLRVPSRRAGARVRGRRRASSRPPGTRSAATASSRSTPRSRPATSGSRPTSSGRSPDRSSTATAGRRPAACPVDAVLEIGLGRRRRSLGSST